MAHAFLRPAGAALAVLAAAALGCSSTSEVRVPNVHTVEPGALVRGGQPSRRGFEVLRKQYAIETVINLNARTADSEAAVARDAGLRYVRVPANACLPTSEPFVRFLSELRAEKQAGRVVYVHCEQGMDRTGIAVAAYRIVEQGWPAGRALSELRQYQSLDHRIFFLNYPSYLRDLERRRDEWRRELDRRAASAPPVSQPAG